MTSAAVLEVAVFEIAVSGYRLHSMIKCLTSVYVDSNQLTALSRTFSKALVWYTMLQSGHLPF